MATLAQGRGGLKQVQGCVTLLHMPAKVLPPTSELRQMVERGMTHKEIADLYHVSRVAVSSALNRAGHSAPRKKYPEVLPWTVKEEHLGHYDARMLRLLGRRRAGVKNSEEMDARLNSWLEKLRSNGAVVIYLPDTPEGFYKVHGEWDSPDIPIKKDVSA